MSTAVLEEKRAEAASRPPVDQRFFDPRRHGQRLRQPVFEQHPDAGDLPDGDPRLGQEPLPLQHPGPADLVHDPRLQGGLHRPPARRRRADLHEPRDGPRGRPHGGAGRGRDLRGEPQARHPPQRRPLLPGAVPEARPRARPRREAPPPGDQHDLRRRRRVAPRRRHGRDREGRRQAVQEQGGRGRDQHEGDPRRPRVGREEPDEAATPSASSG